MLTPMCRSFSFCYCLINSRDFGAESVEAFVYVFVASVDLLNIADGACPFSAKRRDKQGDARSDVRRTHVCRAQRGLFRKSDYRSPVRVAEYDLRSHVY